MLTRDWSETLLGYEMHKGPSKDSSLEMNLKIFTGEGGKTAGFLKIKTFLVLNSWAKEEITLFICLCTCAPSPLSYLVSSFVQRKESKM